RGDEGRVQLPDGPAGPARPRRARHVARHPRRALRGVPRSQLRAGADAAAHGHGRAPGPQVGPRLLRVQEVGQWAMADRPWVMRTYTGHSTAKASNELYRTNLAKGQTGLSIAFDLPTQTGYDPDAPQARGEVGKVGVPVAHLGHMRELMDGIP